MTTRTSPCSDARASAHIADAAPAFSLAYRPPYEFGRLLSFFRSRQLEGVERIDGDTYWRTARVACSDGREATGWVRIENDAAHDCLHVHLSDSLEPVKDRVAQRLRHQFDTDCDPQEVYERIESLNRTVPGAAVIGMRVPGAFDAFEIAVRAILGQQISVKAANKLAARIAQEHGTAIETGVEGLDFLFPSARDFLRMNPIEDALGTLGVVKTRSHAIHSIAAAHERGQLALDLNADIGEQMDSLLAIKGIGPWSASYIAMRALGYKDAFLETDAGIKHALPQLSPRERLELAEQWRPCRSYATVCLWNSLD